MEDNNGKMTLEYLKQKVENQSEVIKELTKENEELYHQYNHLIIRNGKMLKRTDDYQKIIDDLHIRNEELQLINNNLMQLNDKLRKRNELSNSMNDNNSEEQSKSVEEIASDKVESGFDMDDLFNRWKNFPGQAAHNQPNLKKQVLMLVNLYSTSSLRAADLFNRCKVGGVTGARYVSTLKKFDLIRYNGARKKGQYEITSRGIEFIENSLTEKNFSQGPKNTTQVSTPIVTVTSKSEHQFQPVNFDTNDL